MGRVPHPPNRQATHEGTIWASRSGSVSTLIAVMTARIQNATIQPDVTTGVQHLFKAIYAGGVPPQTLELVHLRASQVNGCSYCVDAGVKSAAKAGVSPEKLLAVAAWYENPLFDDAERAALALTEAAQVISLNRAACLHAPFPLAIYTDTAGTHIAYTRPSGLFGPLRSQAIDEIAAGLDVRISRAVEGAYSLP